jgi:hypothetical protein
VLDRQRREVAELRPVEETSQPERETGRTVRVGWLWLLRDDRYRQTGGRSHDAAGRERALQ